MPISSMTPDQYQSLCDACANLVLAGNYAAAKIISTTGILPEIQEFATDLYPGVNENGARGAFSNLAIAAHNLLELEWECSAAAAFVAASASIDDWYEQGNSWPPAE